MIKNKLDFPVFIGGTGRCGTSIMATLLGSDSDFFLPVHENKLFVEQDGFLDLIDCFSKHSCLVRKHFAISRFKEWAQRLATYGCETTQLNPYLGLLSQKIGFQKAAERLQREMPDQIIHIHAIGHHFKKGHYDKCITNFLNKVIDRVVEEGIFVTKGMIKPFYKGKALKRYQILEFIREFAYELYGNDGDIRWVDDTPANSFQIPFLFEIFPNSKFIHMVRNPFDVADSLIDQVWSIYTTQFEALKYIQHHHKCFENLSSKYEKDQLITIKLEDLVRDPLLIQDKLSAFLGSKLNLNQSLISQEKANIKRSNLSISEDEKRELSFLIDWMKKFDFNLPF